MPFTVLQLLYRKPGTTPQQFKTHYERNHVELLRELAQLSFPLSHTRRYIARDGNKTCGAGADAALMLMGDGADFPYDAIVELTFSDETAFKKYTEIMNRPDAAAKIAADEALFMDRSRKSAVVLEEVSMTSGPRYWEALKGKETGK